MNKRMGFDSKSDEWQGPITLLCQLDQRHSSIRYTAQLAKREFTYYPPPSLIGAIKPSDAPRELQITIGRTEHDRGNVRFTSELRSNNDVEEHLVFTFLESMVHSVKYITSDVESNTMLYIPNEVFRGLKYPKRVYLVITLPQNPEPVKELLKLDEGLRLEFKSSARWDYKLEKKSKDVEFSVQKTVAAFLNTEGGDLLIGVDDNKIILGLEPDYKLVQKQNRNGYELFLSDLIFKALGTDLVTYIKLTVHNLDGKDVWRVNCTPSVNPVYLKEAGDNEQLFVRRGNSTVALTAKEAIEYVKIRWQY